MRQFRINFFGGPGCGKSTVAADTYSALKREGFKVEQVQEYVKTWAYEGRKINEFDQLYILAKQLKKEHLLLSNGVPCIITDSPLLMYLVYSDKKGFPEVEALRKIVMAFENKYPSINIYLNRGNRKYQQEGRFETEEQAKEMDALILKYLQDNNIVYEEFEYDDYIGIEMHLSILLNGNDLPKR